MNMTFIGIIILIVLGIFGFFISRYYKSAATIVLYTLGFVFLAASIYLFPAQSWNFFAIIALTIGIILIIISTIIVFKKYTNNIK